MVRKIEGHLDETWVTILIAVNLSLLINVFTDFDVTVYGALNFAITAIATTTLLLYCKRRNIDFATIENDLQLIEISESRLPLYSEIRILAENRSKDIPLFFKYGRIVIVITVFALAMTFGSNGGISNFGKINQVAQQLNSIEMKIDALIK